MATPSQPELSIDDLEQGQIEGASFDHEAHVYLAWLYLDRYPVTEAIDRFTSALKRLTTKLGVPGKYHETISWFFMLIIAQRRAGNAGNDWPNFKDKNPDLLSRNANVLNRYYSKETLATDAARRSFVLPDRFVA
jgi:hypothetical protein